MKAQAAKTGSIVWISAIIMSSCLFVLASINPAMAGKWTVKEDMPTPGFFMASSAADGKIYVIGGHDAGGGMWNLARGKIIEEYDPATDTWTKRADMPTARENPGVSAVNGKIYAFGGDLWWDDNAILKTVEEYNPITDKWSPKNDMPERRSGSSAVAVGDSIYIVGGGDRVWGPYYRIVRKYDPATDTYSSASDMPTARTLPAVSAIDGRVYVIGGAITPFVSTSTVEEYDAGFALGKSVRAGEKFWLPWGKVK